MIKAKPAFKDRISDDYLDKFFKVRDVFFHQTCFDTRRLVQVPICPFGAEETLQVYPDQEVVEEEQK